MSQALELRNQAAAKFKDAADFLEGKDAEKLSVEDETRFAAIFAEAKTLDEKAMKAATADDRIGTLKERLEFYHGKARPGTPLPWGSGVFVVPGQQKSIGQQFVDSESYKELRESGALSSDNARFKTAPVKAEAKAATDVIGSTGAGTGGALVIPQYLPGVLPLPQRPLAIRDLFSQATTEGDTLSYAAQSAFDTAAAPVAQATSLATGLKPQSSIGWQRRTEPIESIATWMAATRRQLADAGQTKSLIDNQLDLMLKIAEEDQLVNGNGTSPNLRGILNRVGVQVLDLSLAAAAKFQNFDAIRDAIRLIQTGAARAVADGVVVNPTDAAIMDEQKDTQSRYVGNGPFNTGPAVLWNRPRVESEAIAAGTALVGAFKVGGTVFQREPVQIFASDSHSDFFIRNLVAVLAEERLGFAVYFPAAFCKVIFRPVWA
jgi:HK97 family phage major capsid protein